MASCSHEFPHPPASSEHWNYSCVHPHRLLGMDYKTSFILREQSTKWTTIPTLTMFSPGSCFQEVGLNLGLHTHYARALLLELYPQHSAFRVLGFGGFVLFFLFSNRVSLSHQGQLWTHSVAHRWNELLFLPASASGVAGMRGLYHQTWPVGYS